jgi:hypothetical protein
MIFSVNFVSLKPMEIMGMAVFAVFGVAMVVAAIAEGVRALRRRYGR